MKITKFRDIYIYIYIIILNLVILLIFCHMLSLMLVHVSYCWRFFSFDDLQKYLGRVHQIGIFEMRKWGSS